MVKSRVHNCTILCKFAEYREAKTLSYEKYAELRSMPKPCQATTKITAMHAWITSELFLLYLGAFDAKMGATARKNVYLCRQMSSIPSDTSCPKNIKVISSPANCTSELQPLNLGVIYAIKRRYRKSFL
jgi:hypothetical protein